MWRLLPGLVFLLALFSGCSPGSEPDATEATAETAVAPASELEVKVDAYFAPYIEASDFNGVVLIARGDEILLHKAYGYSDLEASVPHTLQTRFRIASITKTFTSAAVLLLRDRGGLSLDDPLSDFVEGFPEGHRITIEHLLAHSSGVANPDDSLQLGGDIPLSDLVANITSKPLLFEPGSEHRYSNAGYNLLAWIIEQVSATTYDSFLRENFLRPLAMDDTGNFGGDRPAPQYAQGYSPGPGAARVVRAPAVSTSSMIGSGSLSSTAGDLYRWARAIGREQFFSFDGLYWPYGWGKIRTGDHEGLEQTGGTAGFVSSIAVFPEQETFVVCLNNVEAGAWTRWSRDLSALAFGQMVEIPQVPREVPTSGAELDVYVGLYRSADGNTYRTVNDGGLFLYWNDWPVGKYLTPIGNGRFYPRSDMGTVRFEKDDAGHVVRLVRGFDQDEQVFSRLPRAP